VTVFTLDIKISDNVALSVIHEPTTYTDAENMWIEFNELMEKYGGINGVANRSRLH